MSSVRTAALVATTVLAGVGVFQVALALGAPLGAFAWGGAGGAGRLPGRLRVASAVAALLYPGLAVVLLGAAGMIALTPSRALVGGVAGLFALGTVANAASRSRPERLVMTPVAAVLAIASGWIALGA